MKEAFIAAAISMGMSACLVFGGEALSNFAFYVFWLFNILAWLAVFTGAITGESKERMRRSSVVSCASTAIQIAAMLAAGHSVLAASSFSVSFLILSQVFRDEKEVA